MNTTLLRAVLVAIAASGGVTCASAQQPTQTGALGVWFGGEAIPRALDPGCGNVTGTEGGWTAGALASVPVGSFSVEGRISRHWGYDLLCPGGLRDRIGIHTLRTPDLPAGDFTKTDLRARVDSGLFVFALGGGWAWSKDVPFVVSSFGARVGRSVRFGADLEWSSYRIAWLSRTVEFDNDGSEVRILRSDSYEEWAGAFSLRFVLEVPLGTTPR